MSAFTDFLEQGIRDHFKRDTQLPLEDTYLALFTADPTDTGSTANEASYGGYARQQVFQATTTTPYWTNSSTAGETGIENAQKVSFPQSTGTPTETVTHMAIIDQSTTTGGNMLLKTSLNTSQQISTNTTPEFASGDAVFNFD